MKEALGRIEDDNEYSQEEDSSLTSEDSDEFKAIFMDYITNVTKIVFEVANKEWSEQVENEFNESVHNLLVFKATVDDVIFTPTIYLKSSSKFSHKHSF